MSEYKKIVTKLESNVKPISISSDNAYLYAKAQNEANVAVNNITEEKVTQDNIVEPTKVDNDNIDKFHAVNDVIKISKKKTPTIVYVIMILILVILVAIFIIFELPILRGL